MDTVVEPDVKFRSGRSLPVRDMGAGEAVEERELGRGGSLRRPGTSPAVESRACDSSEASSLRVVWLLVIATLRRVAPLRLEQW